MANNAHKQNTTQYSTHVYTHTHRNTQWKMNKCD